MTEKKLNEQLMEATWDVVKALQEVNVAMVDSAVATQERNLKYTQTLLLDGVEVFKSQMENSNGFMQELIALSHKQQETFQVLVRTSMETYLEAFYRPLTYYKQATEALEAARK